MKAAFTICANNYLPAAKVLHDSFILHHPGTQMFIILADKREANINYHYFGGKNILDANDILNLDIDALSLKYNITELCTTIKPFVFQYLFKKYNQVVYLDPDIKVYGPMTDCWGALQQYTFVLTPHIMSPVDDGKIPSDFYTLRTGIFNLGFIGISLTDETPRFLDWWGARLLVYGSNRWDEGEFYDQIWANYIPVMFNKYLILKHYGYNVANWNWHERTVAKVDGKYFINENYPLVFFHFSSYKFTDPQVLCKYNTRYSRQNRTDLVPLFDEYQQSLTKAGASQLNNYAPYYQVRFMDNVWKIDGEMPFKQKLKRKLVKIIESVL